MTTQKHYSFQRFTHRFAMMRSVSAFLSIGLHRLDTVVLKLAKANTPSQNWSACP
ncbi:MAG: hypothetical protein IPL71_16470 [Anaerolineales bacterium]|uniref:hypothetical protein n=1 Tax=Candidatus Villigracilis proximus TaxID=3140683 RepID=UPI0031367443|nr:hypothetical protein [Anaerolineales bacterium]